MPTNRWLNAFAPGSLEKFTLVVDEGETDRANEGLLGEIADITAGPDIYRPHKRTQLIGLDLHVGGCASLLARVSDDHPVSKLLGSRARAHSGELLEAHADEGHDRLITSTKAERKYYGLFESVDLSGKQRRGIVSWVGEARSVGAAEREDAGERDRREEEGPTHVNLRGERIYEGGL